MVWLYRSPIAVGREEVFTLLKLFYLPSRRIRLLCLMATCLFVLASAISFIDYILTLSKDDNRGHLFWEKPVEQKTLKLECFFADIGGHFLRNLHLHDRVVRDDQRKAAHHHSRIKNMYVFITKVKNVVFFSISTKSLLD